MPHIYSFFEHWFGHYQHVAGAALVSVVLITFGVLAKSALAKTDDPLIPDSKLTLRNFSELVVGGLRRFTMDTMGPHSEKWIPLFGTIFIFILCNNLLGLVPSFNPPTSNVNTNLAIGLMVFLITHVVGFRTHGFAYVKHFMGPVLLLAPLMLPIELISHLVRPMSLTIRLYGNMTGDHTVISLFTDLAAVGIPVVFLGLGTFVCLVQAVVFTMLSMVYIGGAASHDH